MKGQIVCPSSCQPEVYESVAYLYDGTLEGLLTCVFRAYENHEDPEDISYAKSYQPRIGQFVTEIPTDNVLAMRVANGICRVAGNEAYNLVKVVGLSCVDNCGSLTLRFIRHAMAAGRHWGRDVMHPAVEPMLRIRKSMSTEKERMLQFIRFEELEGGLWFATCNPKANIVPFIMDHFSSRFNTQRFIIYDEVHHIAGVHEGRPYRHPSNHDYIESLGTTPDHDSPGPTNRQSVSLQNSAAPNETSSLGKKRWYLVMTEGTGFPENLPSRTENESAMRHAWKTFYDSVSIEARYNPELRVHWMPKRLWRNITEMQSDWLNTSEQTSVDKT